MIDIERGTEICTKIASLLNGILSKVEGAESRIGTYYECRFVTDASSPILKREVAEEIIEQSAMSFPVLNPDFEYTGLNAHLTESKWEAVLEKFES